MADVKAEWISRRGMRWCRPVPVSVLVVVLLVLILISWGPSLFFYENWTASVTSLTRILSAVNTDVHPSDAHLHNFTTHPYATNADSQSSTLTATDTGNINYQVNTTNTTTSITTTTSTTTTTLSS